MDSTELFNLIGYCGIYAAGIIAFILILSLILIFKIRHDRRHQPFMCPRCQHMHYGLCHEKNIFSCDICGHEHIGREHCNNFVWSHGERPSSDTSALINSENKFVCQCSHKLFFCPCNLTRSGFLFTDIKTEYIEHDQIIVQTQKNITTNYYDLLANSGPHNPHLLNIESDTNIYHPKIAF